MMLRRSFQSGLLGLAAFSFAQMAGLTRSARAAGIVLPESGSTLLYPLFKLWIPDYAAANPGVTFIGVAAHSDVAAMQNFVSKYNLNFTNLNDADGSIWARYNVPWQPAYVFYRADGSSTFVNNPTSAMSQQELSGRAAALTS